MLAKEASAEADATQVFFYSGAAGISEKTHRFCWNVPRFRGFVPLRAAMKQQEDM
jgi:hypothetical protein